MAAMAKIILSCKLAVIILSAAAACVVSGHAQENSQVALFVFGDSLYDPGNNNYINTTTDFQANFNPYGLSFFHPPSGRFSDGRLIPDFIAEYAKLPLIPAYFKPGNNEVSYGANFASGGAGTLVGTFSGLVIDLKSQLNHFINLEKQLIYDLGDVGAAKLLSDAVYLFSCGGNDYLSPSRNSLYDSYDPEEFVEIVIGNLTDVIKEIYNRRGRKFGLVNMPPLACFPSVRAGQPGNKCNVELTPLVNLHNQMLSENLEKLEKQLPGFKYSKFDIHASVDERMKNPSVYGFKHGDTACCGSGPYGGIYSCGGKRGIKDYQLCGNISEYFFFDSSHPNEVAYRQFSELFWTGTPEVTGPYNLKSFFHEKGSPGLSLNDEL